MKLSFVILNYNRSAELLQTISKTYSLMAGRNDFEIIAVDNASSDDSVNLVRADFPGVVLVTRTVNNGVAGWNSGFEVARGEYMIVLDDDSHVESGLDAAISYLDMNPDVGVLALNISGGTFITTPDLGWIDKEDQPGFIGCGAIIRKSLFTMIGGFAEWLFIYTHEWDYGIRCMEAGYKVIYFQGCNVTHRTSSINRTTRRLVVFSVRNEMAIVYKFFSKKTRNRYLTRIFLHNLKGIIKYGPSSAGWYYQAFREFNKLKRPCHTHL